MNPDALDPYTRSTAHAAGWQWRIPLQHRMGNGHVFASEFMGEDEAASILMKNLDREPLSDPKTIRFVAGRREKMWRRNCIAIGLSGGFLEPLESTSIYLIQAAIMKLLERFPDRAFSQVDIDDYNRQIGQSFEQIRDFIILHYKATNRDDSPFWNYCREMSVPDSLDYKMRVFRESGYVVYSKRELFIEANWVSVFLGQGIVPEMTDLRVDCTPTDRIAMQLGQMRDVMRAAASSMPRHEDTVARYCAARARH